MHLEISDLVLAACLSLTAWVFVNVLEDEDMILSWYEKRLKRLPAWLAKPLGVCDLCMAGQLGFWGYFLTAGYHVIDHVFFIVITIFFIKIFDRIIYGIYK